MGKSCVKVVVLGYKNIKHTVVGINTLFEYNFDRFVVEWYLIAGFLSDFRFISEPSPVKLTIFTTRQIGDKKDRRLKSFTEYREKTQRIDRERERGCSGVTC